MLRENKILKYFLAFCGTIVSILTILVVVVVARTYRLKEIDLDLDLDGLEDNVLQDDQFLKFLRLFGNSFKLKTVSTSPKQYDKDEHYKLQLFLRKSFPLVFGSPLIEVETINYYSLLLSIKGYNDKLQPYMLVSHLDVVPVFSDQWSQDPFLRKIVHNPSTGKDEMWGRGSVDNKNAIMGILSALESLLQTQWQPMRSFYVGFGHDEENWSDGERKSEYRTYCKGFWGTLIHPPQRTNDRNLATALKSIYDNPQPSMFGFGPEVDMLRYLAPRASWPHNFLFANTWLFGPLLSCAMSLKRESNAMIKTTTAFTMIKAGIKDNVVSESSWALINHRIHPAQSLEDVIAHNIASVNDDRVKFKGDRHTVPHPISPYGPDCLPFKFIARAVTDSFRGAIPIPALTVGNTDSKHYLNLTSNIYRLNPSLLNPEGIKSVHGNNEKLSVTNFKAAILFYRRLIQVVNVSTE